MKLDNFMLDYEISISFKVWSSRLEFERLANNEEGLQTMKKTKFGTTNLSDVVHAKNGLHTAIVACRSVIFLKSYLIDGSWTPK